MPGLQRGPVPVAQRREPTHYFQADPLRSRLPAESNNIIREDRTWAFAHRFHRSMRELFRAAEPCEQCPSALAGS